MLTALWWVLPLAHQVQEGGSCVMLSPGLIAEYHAFDTVFVPFAGTRNFCRLSILYRLSDTGTCPTIAGL